MEFAFVSLCENLKARKKREKLKARRKESLLLLVALASSLKAERNLALRNKDCDRPGLETGEKPGGLGWGCWQVRCGIGGENGEDSRWGGCPPHRRMQWKEGSMVPISVSNPGPTLAGPLPSNVTCTTPHAPNLLHHNYKL